MKNAIDSEEKRCGIGRWLFKIVFTIIITVSFSCAIVVFVDEYVIPFWNQHPPLRIYIVAVGIWALYVLNKILTVLDEIKFQKLKRAKGEDLRKNYPEI